MSNALFARKRIFPRSAFTRLSTPIMPPPAGALKPAPQKGHVVLRGLWK